MPHDNKGQLLQVGDKVILRGTIKEITSTQETYCNAVFVSDFGMAPEHDHEGNAFTISARMAEKAQPDSSLNKDALRAVVQELKCLRKENALLRAKVEVFDVFRAAITGERSGGAMGYCVDPLPEIETFLA